MAAVPKPSQAKKAKTEKRSHHKQAGRAAKLEKAGANGGHYAQILERAAGTGGMTADEVRAECGQRGLTKKTASNYVCYIKRAGHLQTPAKTAA